MHKSALQYIAQALRSVDDAAGMRVLEIGSRDINGSPRALCTAVQSYVGIDRVAGRGVDVVCNAATYQADAPFDLVICAEVLEHAPNPAVIIACAARALAPGGALILTAAGEGRAPHSGVEGGTLRTGEYYQNITEAALCALLADWKDVTIDVLGEDIRAMARSPHA